MKKILLAAAFFAVASINSFGAACVGSGTVASYVAVGSCTVSNGAFSWTLSNFLVTDTTSSGYNNALMTTAGLNLAISAAGSTGINLTYTGTGSGAQFFSYNNQDSAWRNGIWVTANNAASNVVGVGLTTLTNTGTAYQSFQKEIQVPTPFSTLATLNVVGIGAAGSGTDSVTGSGQAQLSLNDRIVFDAKGGRTGSTVSYTNTFNAAAPTTGTIPEPMTFVLMGAGLVGIAALRRRKA